MRRSRTAIAAGQCRRRDCRGCGDLGLPPEVADALLIISRVPGLAAHVLEEQARTPMRDRPANARPRSDSERSNEEADDGSERNGA